MRRATAIGRLTSIAEECQRLSGLWEDEQPVIAAAYAFGDLLDGAADVDAVQIVFVLNVPADELPWGAESASCEWFVSMLRLDKIPVDRYWRPAGLPVVNHVIRRPLRIWSAEHGVQRESLQALTRGSCEEFRLSEPGPDEERARLASELANSLAHLRAVEANYWEPDWRRNHRGSGVYPESHLWNAVHGYLDLLAATTDS